MKRYKNVVIAFFIGALVMVSGQALANTTSLVGKAIQSEVPVYVNGNKVSDAIIVDGKSYAPLRDVAQSVGATVDYQGNTGSTKAAIKLFTDEQTDLPASDQLKILQQQQKLITEEIANREISIANAEAEIEKTKAEMEGITQEWVKETLQSRIDRNNASIEENKSTIADLKAKLTEIEKQINELESAE